MYLQHFGLYEYPFSLTPDTEYCYKTRGQEEAFEVLSVALNSGEGFVKITGEVGTGKTLLCRRLLNSFSDDTVAAYVPFPFITPDELFIALAEELGIDTDSEADQLHLVKRITRKLIELCADGKRVVLLFDEVQALPFESLEALRLLTNLETEKQKLVQVVLFGQPELDVRLAEDRIRQLRQRITFSYELSPLSQADMEGYISFRMEVSGAERDGLFTTQAMRRVYRDSRGIPRLVNIICHKALMLAYGAGDTRVRVDHVANAARDTEGVVGIRDTRKPPTGLWRRLVCSLSGLKVAA